MYKNRQLCYKYTLKKQSIYRLFQNSRHTETKTNKKVKYEFSYFKYVKVEYVNVEYANVEYANVEYVNVEYVNVEYVNVKYF